MRPVDMRRALDERHQALQALFGILGRLRVSGDQVGLQDDFQMRQHIDEVMSVERRLGGQQGLVGHSRIMTTVRRCAQWPGHASFVWFGSPG